jgi:hypothetical protein
MASTPDGAQPVYDPRGVVEAEPRPLAKRVDRLDGLRLAVLDNTKWNAGKLLRRATALLAEEAGLAAVNHYAKESFSKVAAPELIDEIVADNDIAVTAIGD